MNANVEYYYYLNLYLDFNKQQKDKKDDFISPINLTHAINTAWQWGVNIIHIAACHPTQTGVAPDLFTRAVKQCQDNNMLIE